MAKLLKKPLKLALVQLATGADKKANLARARSKVLEATSNGANIVVLPECFNSPYGTKYFPKYAETLLPSPPTKEQSPSYHALSELAKEAKAYVVGGSIPEYWEETKKYYNTSMTFDPSGKLLATHRKVHLFDIDIPGKITFRESEVLSPGNKVTIIDLPEYGKIAVAICYDIRFPELATIPARKNCFLLLYPGAFNLTTGAMHWELQARARAMDNQIYVGLCSPARDMDADYNAWGHSLVVNPNASVQSQLDEHEGIAYADLDGDTIAESRKGIPIETQRRFDVYPDVDEDLVELGYMASSAVPARQPFKGDNRILGDQISVDSARKTSVAQRDLAKKPTTGTTNLQPPTPVVRKRLPWLEKRPVDRKLATSERPQVSGSEQSHDSSSRADRRDGEASIRSTGNDNTLRAVGSKPVLQSNNAQSESLAFSRRSQDPPGSKHSPFFTRRPKPKTLQREVSVSSKYSATHSGSRNHNAGLAPAPLRAPPEKPLEPSAAREKRRKPKEAPASVKLSQLNVPPAHSRYAAIEREAEVPKVDSSTNQRLDNGFSNSRQDRWAKSCEHRIATDGLHCTRRQQQRAPISSYDDSLYRPHATRPPPTKQSTLHKLPLHLVASSDSSSLSETHRATTSDPFTTKQSNARSGPEQRSPILTTAGRPQLVQGSLQLEHAVAGLESLMGEALDIAWNAANSGRPDEVAHVLNEATLALREAKSVKNIMDQPLKLSPAVSVHSLNAHHEDCYSDASSLSSREPTIVTKSSMQPLLVGHRSKPALSSHARTAGMDNPLRSRRFTSSPDNSISQTPPQLYSAPSAESVVRDFAYGRTPRKLSTRSELRATYGAAASFYGDHGESVVTQPGVRKSVALPNKELPDTPHPAHANMYRAEDDSIDPKHKPHNRGLRRVNAARADALRSTRSAPPAAVKPAAYQEDASHGSNSVRNLDTPAFLQPAYFRENDGHSRQHQTNVPEPPYPEPEKTNLKASISSGPPPLLVSRNLSLKHPRRGHISIQEDQGFSLGRYHKRQPIAREWNSRRKRLTAIIACLNTMFIGLIAGIYAGEVPRIQYQLGDQSHWVIFGNMLFFAGLGLSTLIFWPLPLLHGRKPYVLLAFGIVLPLQIPQAVTVADSHGPGRLYTIGLLLPRALTGLALGFANINFLPTLWDLYGASLMSERPHQEIVTYDDVRRQGGGIGVWLGIWTFCFSSSLSVGFCVGACIISRLEPSWGFYIIIMLLAIFLLINVITPETRRAPYRRSVSHFFDEENPEKIKRRVARGEVKLHIYNEGPKWWYEEVWAGLVLVKRMIFQSGFFVMMSYLGWIQAQLTLVILLLGALLSREYAWQSQWVGLAALAVPTGAILAMPLTKASWFSRERTSPPRTDSMTFQPHFSWSTHLIRRLIFALVLPFAGLAYCLVATGPPMHWIAAIIFAGLVGFLTDLGIAECVGIIMETFDTCDLQPGVNTKHRLQSLSDNAKRQRTNYSAFPRVCAGFFAAQSLGFFLAAAATVAAGKVTNTYGTQTSIWIVAAILLAVTLLLMAVMWRWKKVQVIPDYSGSRKDSKSPDPNSNDPEWRPVVIGNPSGKVRRMNILETGNWTRWTEIRKLNKLIKA